MSADIYYFSGTGNSLAVARDIAEGINGRLISIASVIDRDTMCPDADVIGIVFPIYYEPFGGVPLIVRRFAAKLEGISSKYVFSVVTYGTGSLITHRFLNNILKSRGGRLAARFSINMPENLAAAKYNNPENQRRMFAGWKASTSAVCGYINEKRMVHFDTPNVLIGKPYAVIKLVLPVLMPLFKPMALKHMRQYSQASSYEGLMHSMDNSFVVSDRCTGCGTCYRVCPAGNIKIKDGRPHWLHQCEFCLACFQWCPNAAIESGELKEAVRYHHPDVKIADMLREGQ